MLTLRQVLLAERYRRSKRKLAALPSDPTLPANVQPPPSRAPCPDGARDSRDTDELENLKDPVW
jgi:hypothetical protein